LNFLGPEDVVVAPAIDDEGRDMARHRRPVDVGVHRAAPADRVAREQKEPAEALDLVELLLAVGAADLDPVFLDQKRHEVAAIAFAVALDAADLVEKARQDAGVGVAHAGEGVGFVRLHIRLDQRLARVEGPFVHARPVASWMSPSKNAPLSE
jgi:hypothetical protein